MLWTIAITVLVTVLAVVLAMNFATPEKKLDRKIEHHYAISDPQYRREMSVMLGPAIVGGNRVEDLQNGDEIFPAMLKSIRAAKKTITFETYIYWSGDIGKELAQALAERAKAGVKVAVLLDWVGSIKMDEDLIQTMKDAGAQVQRYRPLHWYHLARMNNRTHASCWWWMDTRPSPAAWAWPSSGPATHKTPTIGATCISRSKARWWRSFRPPSTTTGSRPPAMC